MSLGSSIVRRAQHHETHFTLESIPARAQHGTITHLVHVDTDGGGGSTDAERKGTVQGGEEGHHTGESARSGVGCVRMHVAKQVRQCSQMHLFCRQVKR
jgi:hypothetical protein